MKKIIIFVIAIFSLFFVSSCNEEDVFNEYGKDNNDGENIKNTNTVQAEKDQKNDVWTADLDVAGINLVSASQKDENGSTTYNFSVLGVSDDGSPILVSLVKGIEDNVSCFIKDTKTGKAIANVYSVAKNGTKKLISDFSDFAIDKGIVALKVEIENAINVEGLSLNANEYNCYYFGTKYKFTLNATINPSNATNKRVKFYTSNSSVAKVSSKGVVTIVGVGSATITAISLDGAYSDKCYILSKDGTQVLRDSSEKISLDVSEYRTGNRYDDISTSLEGEYTCGEESDISGKLVIGGNYKYSDGTSYGTIQYGVFDGVNFGDEKQLDPRNTYYSEKLMDITYSKENENFFIIQSVKENESSTGEKLYGYIFSEQLLNNKYHLNNNLTKIINFTDYLNYSIESASICSYNGHYFIAITINVNKSNYSYIIEVDEQLNVISSNTKLYTNIKKFKNIICDSEQSVLLAVGVEAKSNTVLYKNLTTNKEYFAYSTYYQDAEITGIDLIQENEFIACCNAKSAIDQSDIAYVEKFSMIGDKFESEGKIDVENDGLEEIELIDVFYHGGVVSAIGNAVGYREEKTGFLNLKKTNVRYCYSIVINVDPYKINRAGGYQYFNGTSGGKEQRFNAGLVTNSGQLIGIGSSNFKNEKFDNGYIEFNVQWLY